MASNDSRKNKEEIVGKDKAPVIPPEPTAVSVSAPVAVKGDEATANSGSTEDKLAAAIKAEGVDLVRVWDGGDNKLFYAEMHKDGLKRLLSRTHQEVDEDLKGVAKSLVVQAGMSKEQIKAAEQARKAAE